jgi:hypothetical protein
VLEAQIMELNAQMAQILSEADYMKVTVGRREGCTTVHFVRHR